MQHCLNYPFVVEKLIYANDLLVMVTTPCKKCFKSRPFLVCLCALHKKSYLVYMFKVHKDAKNAQSFQNIIAYFKHFSAVLYNFPVGYHKIALQELADNYVIDNMQQTLKMWKISIYMN